MPNKGAVQKDFDKLDLVSFCINELEMSSGRVGTFVYDSDTYAASSTYWALSDVYDSPDLLFDWLRSRGFTHHCKGKPFCIGRNPC